MIILCRKVIQTSNSFMYKILSVGSPPRTDAASIKTSATAGNIVVYLEI